MLNYKIAMRFFLLFLVVLTGLVSSALLVHAQEVSPGSEVTVIFLSPKPGQVLQGTILIEGVYPFDGISNIELSFSYQDDPRDTWFLIQEIDLREDHQLSVEWDTTRLTDGEYTLKIIVTTNQNDFIDFVPDLRIRNYTAIETDTPAPTSTQIFEAISEGTLTPTGTEIVISDTATPLPTNPAQINTTDIGMSMGKGVLIAFVSLGIFGLYQYFRKRRRKS